MKTESPLYSVERATITINEMANLMGCSHFTVLNGLNTGQIPAHKIGRRWIVGRQQFYEWVNSGKAVPIGKRI